MKVKENDVKMLFEEIGSGQVFKVDTLLYMKFNEVYIRCTEYNAICLQNAGLEKFSEDGYFKIVKGYFQETKEQ